MSILARARAKKQNNATADATEAPSKTPPKKDKKKAAAPKTAKKAASKKGESLRDRVVNDRARKKAAAEARQVNAPEVDTSTTDERNDDNVVEMSRNIGKGKSPEEAASEVVADNKGKTPALEAAAIMALLVENDGELVFSISRANEQFPYTKVSTLNAIQSAGKANWFKDGQKAHVSLSDNKPIHAATWVQFIGMALAAELEDPHIFADTMLDQYRERFG